MREPGDVPLDRVYRPFTVRYVGPSASGNGSRILIRDLRFNKRKSIEYRDDNHGRTPDQAARYLVSIGISVDGLALADFDTKTQDVLLLSLNFQTQLT